VFAPLFPPEYDSTEKKISAADMTPQQIRDALPDRLPDHPALQARRSGGRGQKAAPRNEATAEKA
jgi:hypothetical protein